MGYSYETKESRQLAKALANDPPTTRKWGIKPAVSKAVGFAEGGKVLVREHTRKYAKGGAVKAMKKGGKCYAAGGVAKLRHKEGVKKVKKG